MGHRLRVVARLGLVTVLAASTACAGWVRLPDSAALNPPPKKVLQVWSKGNRFLVRDLRIDGDTLRGLVRRANYCENCMFAIARDQVDSMRVAPEVRIDAGLVAGIVVVLAYVWLIRAARGT